METLDYLSLYWFTIKLLTFLSVIILFISGLDDFFVDLYYWVRRSYRRLTNQGRYPNITVQERMALT